MLTQRAASHIIKYYFHSLNDCRSTKTKHNFPRTLFVRFATKSFTAEADLQANRCICLKIGLGRETFSCKTYKNCPLNFVESSPDLNGLSTVLQGGLLHCDCRLITCLYAWGLFADLRTGMLLLAMCRSDHPRLVHAFNCTVHDQ